MKDPNKQRSIAIFIMTTTIIAFVGLVLAASNLVIGGRASSDEDLLFGVGLFLFLGSPAIGFTAVKIFKQKPNLYETNGPVSAPIGNTVDNITTVPTPATKPTSKGWIAAAIISLVLFGIPLVQFFGGLVVTGIQNSYYKDKELEEYNQAKAKLEAENKAYEATREQECITADEIMGNRSYNLRDYVLVINERGTTSDKQDMASLTKEIDTIISLCKSKQISSEAHLVQIAPVINQIKDIARRIIADVPPSDLKSNEKNL